ncbi:hypothetical protein KSP40_PGU012940 [Platanthera guangdongensis]|uniref:Uncharacterized protein n=1 Tax=Platanthera guangdongensis TaxID=2320717 RepID=A0ABR2N4I7_9ASPA
MPLATGLVREEPEAEIQGKKRFDMDAPVGPFGTKEEPLVIHVNLNLTFTATHSAFVEVKDDLTSLGGGDGPGESKVQQIGRTRAAALFGAVRSNGCECAEMRAHLSAYISKHAHIYKIVYASLRELSCTRSPQIAHTSRCEAWSTERKRICILMSLNESPKQNSCQEDFNSYNSSLTSPLVTFYKTKVIISR